MDQIHVIRHKVKREKKSQRRIAKELGISRNTVRKYLEDSQTDSSGTAPSGNLRRIADGRNRFSLSLPQAKRRFVVPNFNNQFNQIKHLRTFMANLG